MLNRRANIFTELGTSAIERGLADSRLAEFHEAILAADHNSPLKSRLAPFLPSLSLCSDRITANAPPPIFYVGRDSDQRLVFGDEWANHNPGTLTTPDPDLERSAAQGYHIALEKGSYYGFARSWITIDGRPIEVAFERLIVSLRTGPDAPYRICAYMGVIQDIQRQP